MKILIPAYEPNEKLLELIKEIKEIKEKTEIQIIIINDGSSKNTEKIFNKIKKQNITVLEHKVNKGKGEAIKTGIRYLKTINEQDGCVFADADGQHKVEDILKICKELKNKEYDLVLGVRNFKQKGIPFRSKIGNNISKVLFYIMTGEKILDTQTGLRGYSKNIFDLLLNISGSRYEYEFNVLLEIKDSCIKYTQIPIETVYEDKNATSHFKPIKDSILIYKPVCKFFVSSIIAAIIDFVLLFVFKSLTQNLLESVVLARMISSVINFVINKNYVFNSNNNESIIKAIFKYYILVIIIMLLNYGMLKLLSEIIGINLLISKIITEIVLYSLSFIVQKRFVFKKKI